MSNQISYPYPEKDSFVTGKIGELIQLLDEKGFYPDERLAVLTAVQLKRKGKNLEYTEYEGLTRRRGATKKLSRAEMEEICREADDIIKDLSPMDCWEQLYSAGKSGRGDHAVICGIIYEKFLESADMHQDLIVVDAPPYLIRKIHGDSRARGHAVAFCFSDQRNRDFCRTISGYQKFSYLTVKELTGMEESKALLICAQLMNPDTLNETLLAINGICQQKESTILLFMPDILADRKQKRMAAGEELDGFGIQSLTHFERSAFTAVKRSHVLLQLVPKGCAPEQISVWSCGPVFKDRVKMMQCEALPELSREAWEGRSVSLYKLLNPQKAALKRTEKKTGNCTKIDFCTDFTGVLYTEKTSTGKFAAELRVFLAPNARQTRENKSGMGTKIGEASSSKLYDTEESAACLAPYDILLTSKKMQIAISSAMKKKTGDSLFYFWYSVAARRSTKNDILRYFFCENSVLRTTAATLTYQSTEEDLKVVYNLAKAEKSKNFSETLIGLLNQLYLAAMEQGRCQQNPCEDLYKRIRKQKTKMTQFREAMILKAFEDDQIRKLYAIISDDFWTDDYGLAIGAELRLFAGMTPGEICALTWDRMTKMKVGNQKSWTLVEITRFCESSKRSAHPITSMHQIRAIGLCRMVAEDLDEWMKFQKSEGIFDPKGRVVQARNLDRYSDCRPSDLVKFCKKLEEQVKIPGMLLAVPTWDGQAELVDINDSRSDLWRMTFRFECRYEGEMPMEDLRAYLGLQLQTTDGLHYTDYKNPNRALAQSVAIDRWVTRILNPEVPVYKTPETGLYDQKKFKIELRAGTEPTVIFFETPQDGQEDQMTLELWCRYGACYKLQLMEEPAEKETDEDEGA